jgi:hypothetical protein
VERGDGFDRTEPCGLAGHAVDDATGFVLADGGGSGAAHAEQAFGTVGSHAGEQYADGPSRGRLGD